jgi:predicted GNAT family acetyltransferase
MLNTLHTEPTVLYEVPSLLNTCVKIDLREEVMKFLAQDFIQNTLIIGLIEEKSFEKLLTEESLLIHKNLANEIDGVAIIGKKNLFYSKSDEALVHFAQKISTQPKGAIILCEESVSQKFFSFLTEFNSEFNSFCQEILMVAPNIQLPPNQTKRNLRLIADEDLEFVLQANAEIIESERGYNPLIEHPQEYINSIKNLIQQKKSYIWEKDNELIFKVDLPIKSSTFVYLEGIYVSPKYRRQGIGYLCIQEIKNSLIDNNSSLLLLVNTENKGAIHLYKKLGFTKHCQFSFSSLKN